MVIYANGFECRRWHHVQTTDYGESGCQIQIILQAFLKELRNGECFCLFAKMCLIILAHTSDQFSQTTQEALTCFRLKRDSFFKRKSQGNPTEKPINDASDDLLLHRSCRFQGLSVQLLNLFLLKSRLTQDILVSGRCIFQNRFILQC